MHHKNLLLGCHLSIGGGLEKSIERAEKLGCTCFQIFTKSNRQWDTKALTLPAIQLFKESLAKSPTIKTVIVHASYLINIGSGNALLNKKSAQSLEQELQRCENLGIPYLVLHPGSFVNTDKKTSLDNIINNLSTILDNNPGKTMIILENTAGQGSSIGNNFEDLSFIKKQVSQSNRIGFCLDTCHLFAAGYDFRTAEEYDRLWSLVDKTLGLENLKLLHLNDSKGDLGGGIDRHAHIGKGKIGIEAFRLLMNDKKLFHIPKILETPKEIIENEDADIYNMRVLESLL